jgi:hypothetical protein
MDPAKVACEIMNSIGSELCLMKDFNISAT